jgi:hypothetical protein
LGRDGAAESLTESLIGDQNKKLRGLSGPAIFLGIGLVARLQTSAMKRIQGLKPEMVANL